ncbi:beta-lactamase-like protein [Diaporthe sp. PMI_573]|nr:beta-lactamase-like protein [Diaporthaceae sp. PMI_573]
MACFGPAASTDIDRWNKVTTSRNTTCMVRNISQRELANASRGFVAPLVPGVIKDAAGKTVWDIDSYNFLKSDTACPPTVNEKLWRQGQLTAKQGLFEVVPGIYQLRSLDISNMTIIEGESGIVLIDPLVSCEPAAAGLELYRRYRDPERRRRVAGLVYTHSHTDHFGGAGGILENIEGETGAAEQVPIIAPQGFMEAMMSENLVAGPSMHKRSVYMYGMALAKGADAHVGNGLGMASSTGTRSLIPPTIHVENTGDEIIVDGVRMVFHVASGTEAPAEVNLHFPDFRALLIAETATVSMHNITTLRGAQVRDAKAWAKSLDEAIVLYGNDSDVLLGSHHWPTWGQRELVARLAEQRDLYRFLHDQTVKLMNLGLTGTEIAEKLRLPPSLENSWHCQGFYGSLSHNVKGIYQRYMTWFDGNPASLWKHPPAAEGIRYVECVGGLSSLCDKAEDYIAKHDFRFAATLLSHAVTAFPDDHRSTSLLAKTYESLAYGSENGPWRNFYLTEAQGLRTGTRPGGSELGHSPLAETLTVGQWFEILSVQVDAEEAGDCHFVIDMQITDTKEAWRLTASNGVLNYRQKTSGSVVGEKPDLSIIISKMGLLDVLRGGDIDGVPGAEHRGDLDILDKFLDIVLDRPSDMAIPGGVSLVIELEFMGL